MLRKTATFAVAAVLGTGASIGVAACGEDREGDVQFESGTGTEPTGTGTTGTTGTPTSPAGPTGTGTTPGGAGTGTTP